MFVSTVASSSSWEGSLDSLLHHAKKLFVCVAIFKVVSVDLCLCWFSVHLNLDGRTTFLLCENAFLWNSIAQSSSLAGLTSSELSLTNHSSYANQPAIVNH